MSSTRKWEYRLLMLLKDRGEQNVGEALDTLGEDGWELVTVYAKDETANIFVFKKPMA